MRLDKGTLLIAGAATVVAVVLATKGGPVALVLVAVAAGVAAAALWQLRLNGLDVAAGEAESEKAEEVFALPGPARAGGVVRFLRPEEEVVPFWPRLELDRLCFTGWPRRGMSRFSWWSARGGLGRHALPVSWPIGRLGSGSGPGGCGWHGAGRGSDGHSWWETSSAGSGLRGDSKWPAGADRRSSQQYRWSGCSGAGAGPQRRGMVGAADQQLWISGE